MAISVSTKGDRALANGTHIDDEITQIWKDVEARVVEMAGGDPSKIKQGLDIDDVLQQLDEAQSKDKKASEKYSTVKNIFSRTLQCIQTVGGIVADGASNVFAPAGQCYNALTFVIQAWNGYEGIFESLAGLLEKCIEFLQRLEYYNQSGMDSKLTKVACQHLQIFVKICDRTLGLRSKRSKFAAFMKQMFLNDDGMQGLLSEMQSLVDKERGLVSAQTLKSSNEAAANSRDGLLLTRNVHTSLIDDRNRKQHETELQKRRQAIISALDLGDTVCKPDVQGPWEKAWKRHKENRFEGSGEWLTQDVRFASWVSGLHSQDRILALEGEEGAGKTLLAANVVLHLRKMRGTESKIVVAHNFIDKDSKSTTTEDDAREISRNVMAQIALSHEPITKSVAGICDRVGVFDSPLEIWTALLLENQDLLSMDLALFIVLDGLGANAEVLIKFLQRFSENSLIRRTHILLTGNKQMFESIDKAGGVKMEKILLGEANIKDLEIYINKRMDSMDILKDTSRPGVSDLRAKIVKELPLSTAGDYYKIGRVLDNVSLATEAEEITSLLEAAGDIRPDQIQSDIEKLNQDRTTKEITEINEIILWINAGKIWFTPLQMESALGLMAGPQGSTSLMSLEAKIASKYNIFSTEWGYVDFKVDSIEPMIPVKKRDMPDEQSSSGFKEIQPAEVNIIKHYLSTVCPPDLYSKFGFDKFFECKMTRKGNYICKDPDNAEATMLLRCIACLTSGRNYKTERLLYYASTNLHRHLEEADLSLTDRSIKSEAGLALVKLFSEEHALDSMFHFHLPSEDATGMTFSGDGLPETWATWILSDTGVDSISKWLKDSAVTELVKDDELVKAFGTGDNLQLALLDSAATRAVKDLFVKDTSPRVTIRAYIFLSALLRKSRVTVEKNKMTGDKPDDSGSVGNAPDSDKNDNSSNLDRICTPTLEDVQAVEDWAYTRLNISEKDSTWEAQAALLLSYIMGKNIPKSLVLDRAQKAFDMDPENWVAAYALSRVQDSEVESLKSLERSFDKLIKDGEWQKVHGHKGILARIIYELGDKYWADAERRDHASTIYFKIFDLDRSIALFSGFEDVLVKYAEASRWDLMVSFFERLLDEPDNGPNTTGDFVLFKLFDESFHSLFVNMIRESERFELLDVMFDRAIKKATSTPTFEGLKPHLEFQYGKTLFQIPGHEKEGMAVWDRYLEETSDDTRGSAIDQIVKYTVPAWLELAMAEDINSAPAKELFDKIEAQYEDFKNFGTHDFDSTLGFAQYFRYRGNDTKAKLILKPQVTEALEMLSDDNTGNDRWSLWSLSQVFSVMRDHVNITACLDVKRQTDVYVAREEYEANITKYREELRQKELAESNDVTFECTFESEPEEPEGKILWCDGCDTSWDFASEFWTCLSDSGRVQFDDACYKKLQDGTLSTKVCNKDHEHYWLVKRNVEEVDAVPRDSVMVGERVITFDAWKEEIRRQYVSI